MMFLPSDPDFYRDLPKVLANQPEQYLTTEERQRLGDLSTAYQSSRVHVRVMAWLGQHLTKWGKALLTVVQHGKQLNQSI